MRLLRAIDSNHVPAVGTLIAQGIDLRGRDEGGKTALHYASQSNHVEIMGRLLSSAAADIIDLVDHDGQSALHDAARCGSIRGMRLLASHGASIDVVDAFGLSPLLWAVILGRYGATRTLLWLGADANLVDSEGRCALGWAARLGYCRIARLLLSSGAGVQPATLREAAAGGAIAMVQLLLDAGADADGCDRRGWSAAHLAAEEGHWDVVQLLLSHGADVKGTGPDGVTLLHCAANGGHGEMVDGLLSRGAAPWQKTRHGWTALHHAAFKGHTDVVERLLECGGWSPETVLGETNGWSPLHLAALGGHLHTVVAVRCNAAVFLLGHHCDDCGITARDCVALASGRFTVEGPSLHRRMSVGAFKKSICCGTSTGLREAARSGNVVLARLLLSSGSACHEAGLEQVDGMDSGRRTALFYAVASSNLKMLDLLIEKGANPNILPLGYRAWEQFVSDEMVLQKLRHAGYRKPEYPGGIDHALDGVYGPWPAPTALQLRQRARPVAASGEASLAGVLSLLAVGTEADAISEPDGWPAKRQRQQ